MHRTRTRTLSTPVLILVAAVLGLALFGGTRAVLASRVQTLPALAPAATAGHGALDAAQLYAQRAATVVAIDATIGAEAMTGAGVVVGTDGTIVTASHVIRNYDTKQDASVIYVRFTTGDEVPAQRIAIDRRNDLAILKVDPRTVTKLVAAPLAEGDAPVVGAEIAAIGSPFGNDWSQQFGHVSGVHRVVGSRISATWQIPDAVQFDASINEGNSGGPLFDARGSVIGIVQQIETRSGSSAGVAFAVASPIVARAVRLAGSNAEIPYAWLGIDDAVSLTPQIAQNAGIGVTAGAVVQSATGPALRAGIQGGTRTMMTGGRPVKVGDVIIELAGRPVASADDLKRITGLLDLGSPVEAVVMRGQQKVTLQLQPAPLGAA